MTLAVNIAQSGSNNASFRNRIINGGMVIDQRNAGASVTPSNNTYTLDRWQGGVSQASKFTIQQNAGSVTPPTGYKNYLGVTSSSAYSVGASDYFFIQQRIEGYNIADLGFGAAGASTVTLSFWVRSSLTGTFGGALTNSAQDRNYPFAYTISTANTWEQKSVTIAGDTTGTWLTTNGQGIGLIFGLGVGSTYSGTAGAWTSSVVVSATGATSVVGTNGATWYVTGVQLEAGTTASPFEYRQYGTELALCQRYFTKIGDGGVTSYYAMGLYISGNSGGGSALINFPVPLRTQSFSVTTSTNSTWYADNQNFGSSGSTTPTLDNKGLSCLYLSFSGGSGGTSAASGRLLASATANCFVNINAEL